MARVYVTATFTGVTASVNVSWSGISAKHLVVASVVPNAGYGSVGRWLTNRSAGGATVNIADPSWKGIIQLKVSDSDSALTWPSAAKPFRLCMAVPNAASIPHTNAAVYQFPVPMPSDVPGQTVVANVANISRLGGAGNSLTSNIAFYPGDGSHNIAGAALAEYDAQTVPGNGTDWLSLNIPNATQEVIVVYSVPASTNVGYVDSTNFGTLADSTTTVNPAPVGVASPVSPLWWTFDFNTARPRFNWWGNSISIGSASVGTPPGPLLCAARLLAIANDWAIASWGSNASTFAQFSIMSSVAKFNDNPHSFIEWGVNDSANNSATMFANLTSVVNAIRALTSGKIWMNTVGPVAGSIYDANQANISGYNTLVLANTLGVDGIYDRSAKQNAGGEGDNTTQAQLYGPFDCGDRLHLNNAGQVQDKNGVAGIIVSP